MAFRYVGSERDQLFLMPVSMRDWLDEGHLAWFVLDVVARVDTSGFHARYRLDGAGRPPYDPEMMLALLFYAYATGVRSSRRVEAACCTDAAFKVIAGGATPDHATIARFVVSHEAAIEAVFVDVLRLCVAAGLVSTARVAVDGTKLAANAAMDQNRDAQWIRAEVARILAEAIATDTAEDAQVGLLGFEDLPLELASRGGRLAKLEAALAEIAAHDAAREAKVADQGAKVQAATDAGRRRGGAKPTKDPRAALSRAEADHAMAARRVAAYAARDAARPPGRHGGAQRLQAALAKAETALEKARAVAASAAPSAREAKLAAATEAGRLWAGRKPKDPHAALVVAEADYAVAARRVAAYKQGQPGRGEPRSLHAGLAKAAAALEKARAVAASVGLSEREAKLAAATEAGRQRYGAKPTRDPVAALARAEADHAIAAQRVAAHVPRRRAKPTGPGYRGPKRAQAVLAKAAAALEKARAAAATARPATATVANIVDPESRKMKCPAGFTQGFNCQLAANEHQVVVAHAVTQQVVDSRQLEPMMAAAQAFLDAAGAAGPIGVVLADAGYWSEHNASFAGPDRLIATQKDWKQRQAARLLGTTTGPPPEGASVLEAMEHRLRTPEGAEAYKARSCTVETVFANGKENRGYRRFRRRGLAAARSEWSLMNTVHNLGKLFAQRSAGTATAVT